jgi:hypothetical protein
MTDSLRSKLSQLNGVFIKEAETKAMPTNRSISYLVVECKKQSFTVSFGLCWIIMETGTNVYVNVCDTEDEIIAVFNTLLQSNTVVRSEAGKTLCKLTNPNDSKIDIYELPAK